MDPHPTAGLADAGSNLEQFQSQGAPLGSTKFSALAVFTQKPELTMGKDVQKKPKLFGQKSMATETIGVDIQLEFFNPILCITTEWSKVQISVSVLFFHDH